MEPKDLIDLLNKERNYHSKHPQEVNIKFIYTIGASITGIIISILFKKSDLPDLTKTVILKPLEILFILGFTSIFLGLGEHYSLHFQQRIRIEKAINDIASQFNHFNYDAFIAAHGLAHMHYFGSIYLSKPTPLFTNEPDTRSFWKFHDRKIELGILLILISYGYLIYYVLCTPIAKP
jgi:hypothetical protein